ncbi:MAG: CDGSH iron-sulfur domain-containing protein [Hyphomicrobiales bacterium]|nr:CDGSH iron-sulfur domain-containing protein [Hyphomicrobiales bacterium]MBV9590573.1 CDGSH iron-sulfur domain-containing protein [Hyphomicrobiales bacterium]
MTSPHIAGKEPIAVPVKPGQSYWWCACGQSKKQPFCDGSHKGSSFTPIEFKSEGDRTLYFCACKHTKHSPLCDGTHKTL